MTLLAPAPHPTDPQPDRRWLDLVSGLGTILGIWAHPDDEAYLSAGLMARAVGNGQRVVVAHATLGEAGTDDPAGWPPARLARRRRDELTASLAELGVDERHELGYVDGTCHRVPGATAVSRVARIIARVDPDTIVTFGPEGMTGHPDHRAVSRWVQNAWHQDGGHRRLLHATMTPGVASRFAGLHRRLGVFAEGLPRTTPVHHLALQVHLDGEELERKVRALRAHRSQTTAIESAVGPAAYRAWWATESFVDGADRSTAPGRRYGAQSTSVRAARSV